MRSRWRGAVRNGEYVRENETIAVHPVGILGVERHELVEQDVSDWGHSHGRARVARVRRTRSIDLWAYVSGLRCWEKSAMAGSPERGQERTARVRIVLMASSSTLSYGMTGNVYE